MDHVLEIGGIFRGFLRVF